MVVPLGGAGAMGDTGMMDPEPPPAIKNSHYKWWWVLVVLLCCVCIGRFCGTDFLGGVMSGIMAFIVYYMVKENCSKMSQYCLMVFGFMCLMNTILECIALVGLLGGRTEQTTAMSPPVGSDSGTKTTYTVTLEKHPFFDKSQGPVYNIQSAMMIASPVCNLIGCLLAYWSYNAYPTSLFEDREEDIRPFAGRGGMAGGFGGGMAGGYGGGQSATPAYSGSGHVLGGAGAANRPNQPRLFEGSGQRLGS
jgi:hypothetical protein